MGARLFIDDDRSYQDWLQGHPNGFVVNTSKNPSPICDSTSCYLCKDHTLSLRWHRRPSGVSILF